MTNTKSYQKWPAALRLIMAFIFTVAAMTATPVTAAAPKPQYYSVTASANYRPVDRPGTQRRVAQTDAEVKAHKQIYEYVGSMRLLDGRTINDILARDARLKALILETVRKSETYDWAVAPGCACVQVWVRLDINLIRNALGACGY